MKKKFGFTLAEVLITLGIIGVVAALTAPSLVKNSGQAKIGPNLAKFVNTFETACEQMMTDEGVSKLSNLFTVSQNSSDAKVLMDKLSEYMIMSPDKTTFVVKAPDGSAGGSWPNEDGTKANYQLKDGSTLAWMAGSTAAIYLKNANGAFKGPVMVLLYDINGHGGNNIAGKEVFVFIVDDSGILVPGNSNADNKMYDHSDLTFTFSTCQMNSNDYLKGLGCTGIIADNGWKADY